MHSACMCKQQEVKYKLYVQVYNLQVPHDTHGNNTVSIYKDKNNQLMNKLFLLSASNKKKEEK